MKHLMLPSTREQAKEFLRIAEAIASDFEVYPAPESKVNLGDRVECMITGFQGIAVARHTYLAGCARISVQPEVSNDHKLPESATFDEPLLVVLNTKAVKQTLSSKPTG